jgi:hypothetical protein
VLTERFKATAAQVDVIEQLQRDQDLLVLANRAPLPILSPRDAWSRLRGEGAV